MEKGLEVLVAKEAAAEGVPQAARRKAVGSMVCKRPRSGYDFDAWSSVTYAQ